MADICVNKRVICVAFRERVAIFDALSLRDKVITTSTRRGSALDFCAAFIFSFYLIPPGDNQQLLPKPWSAQQPTGSARPMARLLGQVIMMTTMTTTMMVMVMVMMTPIDNHFDQGPLPGPPVCRRDGGRSRPVRHCLGDHRRQQVGQWGHQDLQVTIFLPNMFLVTNICR